MRSRSGSWLGARSSNSLMRRASNHAGLSPSVEVNPDWGPPRSDPPPQPPAAPGPGLRPFVVAWAGVIPLLVIAARPLAARAVYAPPAGIGGRPISSGPEMSAIVSEAIFLIVGWTAVVVGAVMATRARPGGGKLPAALWCVLVPVMMVAMFGAYSGSHKGCGTAYREMVTPTPAAGVVVSEDYGPAGAGGPGVTRWITMEPREGSAEMLFTETVVQLESLGWEMNVGRFGPHAQASGENGDWSVDVGGPGLYQSGETVDLVLDHLPSDPEWCLH